MTGRIALLLALASLAGACASSSGSSATEAEAGAGTEAGTPKLIAPRPFTADEIRDANPPGTVLVFRTTTATGVSLEHFEFGATDGETVALGGMTTDEQGAVLESREPLPVAWVELRDHATFPAVETNRSKVSVTVPAGTFDCMRFEVHRPDGSLETYHFAEDRAGPPVLLTIRSGGDEVLRMELLEAR